MDGALLVLLLCMILGKGTKAVETGAGGSDIQRGEKLVALTFDDGPHPGTTTRLLEGLKERGVHATFFLIGKNIEGNEEIVKQISEDGHLIGCHTYNHVDLTGMSLEQAKRELEQTNEKIFQVTGKVVEYVRPPFGKWNEKIEETMEITPVLWTVDPRDWEDKDSGLVERRILKDAENGDIILLHDIYDSSVEAALGVVDDLLAEGYEFVTIDELIEE